MKNKFRFRLFLITVFSGFLFTSCTSVKPWQKMYINDVSMKLSNDKLERFESNFQSYREGSLGAEGGAVGGGCGCN